MWMQLLTRKLNDMAFSFWEAQNAILHDAKALTAHLQVVSSIWEHYARPHNSFPSHVHHLFVPLPRLLKKTKQQLDNWLLSLQTLMQSGPIHNSATVMK